MPVPAWQGIRPFHNIRIEVVSGPTPNVRSQSGLSLAALPASWPASYPQGQALCLA